MIPSGLISASFFLGLFFILLPHTHAQPRPKDRPPGGSNALTYTDLQAGGDCMGGSTMDSAQTCIVPSNTTLILSNLDLEVQLELTGAPGARMRIPSPTKNSLVKTSRKLTLSNLHLESMTLVSTDLNSNKALLLAGIQLSPSADAQLVVANSIIALSDCAAWSSLASSICSMPSNTIMLGNSSVNTSGMISVSFLQVQGSIVTWYNVTVMSPSCQTNGSTPSVSPPLFETCNFTSTRQYPHWDNTPIGPQPVSILVDLIKNHDFPNDQASADFIIGPITFAGNGSYGYPVSIGFDLKLTGDQRASVDVNFDRLPKQVSFSPSSTASGPFGSLTLHSLVLWNLPISAPSFPNGLLSILPWYADLSALPAPSGGLPYLVLNNCILVVTDEEFDFLNNIFSNNCKLCGAWLSDPTVGPFDYLPRVNTSARFSFTINVSGGGGRWSYSNVIVVPWSSPTAQRFNRGRASSPSLGLSAGSNFLSLPSDDPSSLPLSFYTPIDDSVLSLSMLGSTLDAAPPAGGSGDLLPPSRQQPPNSRNPSLNQLHDQWVQYSQYHFIFALDRPNTGSVQIVNFTNTSTGAVSNRLRDSIIIVGNPSDPSILAMNFDSNLDQKLNTLRIVVISPNIVLKLSCMTLYNLPPYTLSQGSNASDPIISALGNYTLGFWNFGLQRSSDSSVAVTRARGQLLLTNCVIVINPIELQVIRSIITGGTNVTLPIDPAAQSLIAAKMAASTATLSGSDIDLALLKESIDPQNAPGDVFFSGFEFFGVRGINITITCKGPLGASLNFQSQGSLIGKGLLLSLAVGSRFPPPELPDKPPRPAKSPNPRPLQPARSSPPPPVDSPKPTFSLQLTGWQLALIILASVAVAALLILALFIVLGRRRKARYLSSGSGSGVDIEMRFKTDLKDNQAGGVTETLAQSSSSGHVPSSPSVHPTPNPATLHGAGASGNHNVRNDTEVLIDAIFEGASMQSGVSDQGGASNGAGDSSMGASVDPLAPSRGHIYPWQDPRKEMQRQMDELKEELRGGESPWEVKEMIGKGGFGVVYKGTWRGLEVAIKRVIFQMTTADAMAERSRRLAIREAAINSTLNHPNVVSTYHYDMQPLGSDPRSAGRGIMDWQLYLIQEYCEGGSLFDAIQGRIFHIAAEVAVGSSQGSSVGSLRPRVASILSVAIDIASGCSYIHSKNIIHGDLKPDNVLLKAITHGSAHPSHQTTQNSQGTSQHLHEMMSSPKSRESHASRAGSTTSTSFKSLIKSQMLDKDPIAKICDFGMSINIRGKDSHVSGVRHGTPLYIAPEILANGKAQKAADVYSFGVILWELYHGCLAWSQLMHLSKEGGVPASLPKKGKGRSKLSTYHPSLFAYHDCLLPRYEQLGRQCLKESPLLRPTFDEVLRELQSIKAEWDSKVTADLSLEHWGAEEPSSTGPQAQAPGKNEERDPEQAADPSRYEEVEEPVS